MSIRMPEDEGWKLWGRVKKSFSETEPRDLVKFVVIGICMLLVYMQVTACFKKLENPTIASHTQLKLNDTMSYPALTICREPPFNRQFFAKYNISLAHFGSYPMATQWESFDFEKYSISDFFSEAVYDDSIFISYNLGSNMENLIKTTSLHLTHGLCHSFRPRNYTTMQVGKNMGYGIGMMHDLFDYKPIYDEPPGWYVYIHEPREKFSENTYLLAGRQDNIFLRVGEEVEVTLDATEFRTIKNCNNSAVYSETECEEKCWVESIMRNRSCTGPWLPHVNLTYCNNYDEFFSLHRSTIGEMTPTNCCLPHCTTKQYHASVVGRTQYSSRSLRTTVFVYFTSKAVLTMTENYAYDWNLFVADLGGSLGFLLGLSVLGIVTFLEQIVKILFWGRKKKQPKLEKIKEDVVPIEADYKWKFETLRVKLPVNLTKNDELG